MGLAVAEVQLRNPRRPELGAVRIEALADTGSVHLCIPRHCATCSRSKPSIRVP